jgi:hypothetical protein
MSRDLTNRGMMSRGSEALPDPFCDIASMAMPSSMSDAFRWCERVYERMGVYRSAVSRIIAYFITELQVDAKDREERKKYEDYLNDDLEIKSTLVDVGLDYFFMGNSVTSLIVPLKRYLRCPCGFERPLSEIRSDARYNFKWQNFEFYATCARCGRAGRWNHQDRRSGGKPRIIIKRWNPHELETIYDRYTEKTRFVWKIPEVYRMQVRNGEPLVLENAHWNIIEAVRDNRWILFDEDYLYHMKEHRLAGQENNGWGMAQTLTNFGISYYAQILHKYNEALALDYVMPFRVITPEIKGGPLEAEPVYKAGMNTFSARVNSMIRARRSDPTRWNVLPFPVKYQALGGDATTFMPKDLLEQAYDTLLNSIGCPIEFYRGTVTAQQTVPMLRIFEAHHQQFRDQLIKFLQFVVDGVSQRMRWEPVKITLLKPRHADDITRQQMQLQLGLNKQISQTTSLRSLDLDFTEETRRKLEEQQIETELTSEKQEEMDQQAAAQQLFQPIGANTLLQQQQQAAQQGGQPGAPQPGAPQQPGGMPQAGGGLGSASIGQSSTPEQYVAQASQIAQQLLPLDETTRKRQLSQLRQQDPVLQRMVIDQLEQQRESFRTQGGQMLMQQQGGQQAA